MAGRTLIEVGFSVDTPTDLNNEPVVVPGQAPYPTGTLAFVISTGQMYVYQPNGKGAVDAFHVAALGGGFWQLLSGCGDSAAKYRGFVEMNANPAEMGAGTILTTATINVIKFYAKNGGTVANAVLQTTTAQATSTAATTLTASAAVAGTGGVVRLTTGSTASWATNDIAVVTGLVGTTEGNGTWQLTVVDGTHVELIGSVFAHTYVSGGTVTRSVNTVALYDSAGVWLGAAADQVSAWEGAAGTQTMALANTANPGLLTLNQGEAYYLAVVCKATTPAIFMGPPSVSIATANLGLTAGNLLWSTAASSGATKLLGSLTPSGLATTNAEPIWAALS